MTARSQESPPYMVRTMTTLSRRVNMALFCVLAAGVVGGWFFARDAFNAVLLVLAIVVLIAGAHELAHFVTAKLLGVDVIEFGLGFPPRMTLWIHEGTAYSLGWVPLGGFVKLAGERDPSHPRSFAGASRRRRLAILVSGSVANLLLPLPLLTAAAAFTLLSPQDGPGSGRAVITEIAPNSVASLAGLRPGDVIHEVAGRETELARRAVRELSRRSGEAIDLLIQRDEDYLAVDMLAAGDTSSRGAAAIGVTLVPECALSGSGQCPPFTSGIEQEGPGGLIGPLGLIQLTSEIARGGISSLLILTAVLSLNCAVLNMLPLPMLDGGRVLFLGVETLRGGRRFAVRTERLLHFSGLLLVLSVIVFATVTDIQRIF